MKRFINLYVPVTTCNLKCPYCYITQEGKWKAELPKFNYSAEHIGKALSAERLGGICHINICGGGETLLPEEVVDITYELLKQGHYIMIVTNGTVSKRFDQFLNIPEKYRKQLGFKFSFHYLEFKRTNKLDDFVNNVRKVKEAGMSISVEMTPYDELIPYIDEIKEFCLEQFGAYCHVTVARKSSDPRLPILSDHTKEDYYKIWNTFDSELFRFKMSTFNVKRKEYCYAGCWSLWVNAGNGITTQCYASQYTQNIFEDISKPITFLAVGNKCSQPHCHNAHALLTLGVIPEMATPYYSEMRDRKVQDGSWLNEEMKEFLSHKLVEENKQFTQKEKRKNDIKCKIEKTKYIGQKIIKKVRGN